MTRPLPDLGLRALAVAPLLLGCVLRVDDVALRLTEVEAYEGADDPASHAFAGLTTRNAPMFGPAGRFYVYFSYGMHHAANLVCGPEGTASAVLLRAGEVVAGLGTARSRRPGVADVRLARGPGNLGACLGLTTVDSGLALGSDRADLVAGAGLEVRTGPRVGVSHAAEVPWRFWLAGEPTVSAYRRSPRAPVR